MRGLPVPRDTAISDQVWARIGSSPEKPPSRRRGMWLGLILNAGALALLGWQLTHASRVDSLPLIAALAVLVGFWAVQGVRFFRARAARAPATIPRLYEVVIPRAVTAAEPPREIIYEVPVAEPTPSQARAVDTSARLQGFATLQEKLLYLCKQDRDLFDRLLRHERDRHPGAPWPELVRLAIEHYEADMK